MFELSIISDLRAEPIAQPLRNCISHILQYSLAFLFASVKQSVVDTFQLERLQTELREKAERIERLAKHISSKNARQTDHVNVYNLLLAIKFELLRLSENAGTSIQYIAFGAKSIFEIHLILRFILQSEENLHAWISRRIYDEIEIKEGVLEIGKSSPEEGAKIKTRISEMRATAEKHGFVDKLLPALAEIARTIGLEKEFHSFYKIYSKFNYPSSWRINESNEFFERSEYRAVLLERLFYYFEESLSLIAKKYGYTEDE